MFSTQLHGVVELIVEILYLHIGQGIDINGLWQVGNRTLENGAHRQQDFFVDDDSLVAGNVGYFVQVQVDEVIKYRNSP